MKVDIRPIAIVMKKHKRGVKSIIKGGEKKSIYRV